MTEMINLQKTVRIAAGILALLCTLSSFNFAEDRSPQFAVNRRPPGNCPAAFANCIFYGGDSDWNTPGGNISYLPILGPNNLARIFDGAVFTSKNAQVVNGIFVNVLVDPSELSLYDSGYWEVRVGVQDGFQGWLLAAGYCNNGSGFKAVKNGQDANSNVGVWFACDVGITLPAGTYSFSMVPLATGAIKPIFEWTTSVYPPPVGTRPGKCDTYLTSPSCAYYDAPLYGMFYQNTLNATPPLPYPTAAGPSGAFSWGLY